MKLAAMLETEGGRILAAFALLLIGFSAALGHLPKAEDIIVSAGTLIARELMSNRSSS